MKSHSRLMPRPLIPAMVAALLLTSCGGGGEGDDADAPDNEPPPQAVSPESLESPESTESTQSTVAAPRSSEAPSPLGEDNGDGDDRVDFVTTPSTTTSTTTTTTEPTTTTTSTTTSTTSTTTTSTSTTSTSLPPTTIRCSLAADALFEPGEAVLTPAAVAELERIVSGVIAGLGGAQAGTVSTVTVEGHTDHRGSDEENLALSQARADAASAALIDAGIAQDLITAVGHGETQAAQGDPSDDQMAADRRVDIVIEADVPITTPC